MTKYFELMQRIAAMESREHLAFSMLEICGVPRDRARSIHNGIDVLATRCRRERHDLSQALNAAQDQLRRCRAVMEANDPGNFRDIFGDAP